MRKHVFLSVYDYAMFMSETGTERELRSSRPGDELELVLRSPVRVVLLPVAVDTKTDTAYYVCSDLEPTETAKEFMEKA